MRNIFWPHEKGLVSACAFNFSLYPHQVGILTMGRLTRDDGKTADEHLEAMKKNGWRHMVNLAPKGQTVVDFKRGRITWSTFVVAYLEKLAKDPATISAVNELIDLARDYQVVVTCVEEAPDFCHRRILLLWCKLLAPDIEITIL